MIITVEMLEAKGACADQVELFICYFGRSAEVTLENCLAAAELVLDIERVAREFLSDEALARYKKETISEWERYNKEIATAFYNAAAGVK